MFLQLPLDRWSRMALLLSALGALALVASGTPTFTV